MNDEHRRRLRLAPLGYRRGDVDLLVERLRSTSEKLAQRVEASWQHAQLLERELERLRRENEELRAREQEVNDAMRSAHRRAAEVERAAEQRAEQLYAQAERRAAGLTGLQEQLLRSIRTVLRAVEHTVARAESGDLTALEDELDLLAVGVGADGGPGIDDVFEAHVELEAGPFADFTELSAFERALTRLPKIDDVYVRRFVGDRAQFELSLREQTALVRILRESLPYEFEVTAFDPRRISLTIGHGVPVETP